MAILKILLATRAIHLKLDVVSDDFFEMYRIRLKPGNCFEKRFEKYGI